MSRLAAKVRCSYYPLPLREAERIRNLVQFPAEPFSALDPCVGEGIAFAAVTRDSTARRYGIELDAYRAEQAAPMLTKIIQGNCLETYCPVESFSLLYENGSRQSSSITRFVGSFPAVCCFSLFRQTGRRTVPRFWPPISSVARFFASAARNRSVIARS